MTLRLAGGTAETFGYDHGNRMISYAAVPEGSAASATWSYRFGPTGERLARVDLLGAAGNEEWFAHDGANVTADYRRTTGSGGYTLERTYAGGRGMDAKVARFDAAGAPLYYLGDALGSVHQLADPTGTIVNRELTTAWGLPMPGLPPVIGAADRHGFTQRERDPESALMHYRARSYDPRVGRFVQKDPVWQVNLFVLCQNNPVSRSDPSGALVQMDEWELATLIDAFEEGELATRRIGDTLLVYARPGSAADDAEIIGALLEIQGGPRGAEAPDKAMLDKANALLRALKDDVNVYTLDNLGGQPAGRVDQTVAGPLGSPGSPGMEGLVALFGFELFQIGERRLAYVSDAAKLPNTEAGKVAREALKVYWRQHQTLLGQKLTEWELATRTARGQVQRKGNAAKTNSRINRSARVMRGVGAVLFAYSVGIALRDVVDADEGERLYVAAENAGGLGGAIIGGKVGAVVGARTSGMVPSPFGKAVWVLGHSLVYGWAGAQLGEDAVRGMLDSAGRPRGSIMDDERAR